MDSKERYKILYVDDEEANLRVFLANFNSAYEIHVASSGKEGLSSMDLTDFHIIISDQRMPAMTGLEFLSRAKVLQPDAVLILLTGFADMEVLERAVNEIGIWRYISKPWRTIEFSMALKQATTHSQLYLDKKNAQETLLRSEEKLKEIQSIAKIGGWEYDVEKDALQFSMLSAKYVGVKEEPYALEDFLRILDGEYFDKVKRLFDIEDDLSYVECDLWDLKLGTIRSVALRALKEGSEGRYLKGSVQDLTAQKQMEFERNQSEEKFQVLFESVSDAILTVDEGMQIHLYNYSAYKLFNYSSKEIKGFRLEELLTKNSRAKVQTFLRSDENDFTSTEQIYGLNNKGIEFPIELSRSKMLLNGDVYQVINIRDISQRLADQKKLQLSEAKFREIFETINDVYFRINSNFVVELISPSVERNLNYTTLEVLGKSFPEFFLDQNDFQELKYRLLSSGLTVLQEQSTFLTKEGQKVYVSINISRVENSDSYFYHGTIRNITAKKEEEQLLMNAIIKTEESERSRIAKELHDSLGQHLTTSKLNLGYLKEVVVNLEEIYQQKYKVGMSFLQAATIETRNISHNLMPKSISDFGLVLSIESLLEGMSKEITNVDFQFYTNLHDQRLDDNIEVIFYRIIQEGINNILKHAQATEAMIQLTRHDDQIFLTIEDNGVGFDYDKEDKTSRSSLGLDSMKSRVGVLGGVLTIDSKKGQGTSITIELK